MVIIERNEKLVKCEACKRPATSLNSDKAKYATAPITDDGRITISKICENLHVGFGSVCSFV